MDVVCYPKAEEEEEVIPKDPLPIGPEGENISIATPDSVTPDLPDNFANTAETGTSSQNEEQKESKMQTLKRLVVGKPKSKNGEEKKDSSKSEEKKHTSRALRKSLSRVFSVSSSSLGRVWSSFSATRIHSEGDSGTSAKSFGKMFGKKNKENENELGNVNPESKTHTLGRRFSATFRSAFGKSKET